MGKFTFGPVPSRRLGFSLGVDIIPGKYCSFDCIYCQLGKTTQKEVERRSFSDPDLIVKEVLKRTEEGRRTDFITLSGSGEPTLSADIGEIIRAMKRRTSTPVAVITNGSLLFREDVVSEIGPADVVLPSLDATGDAGFELINRPHPALSFDQLVEGLRMFRRAYKGKIWLEIMLIKDINNGVEYLAIFKQIVSRLGVDRVQLNTVVRPPLEEKAQGLDGEELLSAAGAIGSGCEIIPAFEKKAGVENKEEWWDSVIATLRRRSLSLDDIVRTTGVSRDEAKQRLERLVAKGRIRLALFGNNEFYAATEEDPL
jgi:wyosine [tRNA(Phe)-imidazoG37] synthetase (radical SAM superfamily)